MNATAHMASPRSEGFMTLVGDLQTDIKNLIKKEIELAKTEMGEKMKVMGRNAAFAAVGGVMALMAVFMLFLGIGAIIAQLLQKAGLSPGTAYFIAYMGFGLVLGIVGYLLIQKAIHAFSKVSLAPEKALDTMKQGEPVKIEIKQTAKSNAPQPSSDDLKTQVIRTRERMDAEMSELKARLTPGYIARSFAAGMKHHPVTALLFGAGTSLGGYLYWRKRHQFAIVKQGARAASHKVRAYRLRRATV